MKNIKIIPLTGIEIEQTGNVSLGQSKASIENLLGRPSSRSNDSQWYYDEHEFRIDFDKKNNAEFIEFICGPFPEKSYYLYMALIRLQ